MEDTYYILYFLDPLKNSSYTNHFKFKKKEDAIEFVMEDVEYFLKQQQKFVSGLKGNIDNHLEKYRNYLLENDELYFYGEYNEITNNPEYVYKYWIKDSFD